MSQVKRVLSLSERLKAQERVMREKPVLNYQQWRAWRARQELKQAQPSKDYFPAPVAPPPRYRISEFVRRGVGTIAISIPRVAGYRLRLPDGPVNRHLNGLSDFLTSVRSAIDSASKRLDTCSQTRDSEENSSIGDVARVLSSRFRTIVTELGFDLSAESELLISVTSFLEQWIESEFADGKDGQSFNQLLLVPVADLIGHRLLDFLGEVRLVLESQEQSINATSIDGGAWIVTPPGRATVDPTSASHESSAITHLLDAEPQIVAVIPGWRLGMEIPLTPKPFRVRCSPHALLKVQHRRADYRPLHLLVDEGDVPNSASTQAAIEQFWVRGVNCNRAFGDWAYIRLTGNLSQRASQLYRRVRSFHETK